MKVCFKTADGLLCLEDVPEHQARGMQINRCVLRRKSLGAPTKPDPKTELNYVKITRAYERTVDRLAGVPVFEEVL